MHGSTMYSHLHLLLMSFFFVVFFLMVVFQTVLNLIVLFLYSEMLMTLRHGFQRRTRLCLHQIMAVIWLVSRHCRESMKSWREI